jgi:hypothetical protein
MKALTASLWFVAGALGGALACGPALTAQPAPAPGAAADPRSPLGVPGRGGAARLGGVLLVDRTDLRIGTTVQYSRIPTASEINDLSFVRGLMRVVLVLDRWPDEYAPLESLNRMPVEVDLVAVLPGYPPSRGAAEAWNILGARTRIVVHADGPPPSGAVFDLNAMRSLERIIVDTDDPSRAGFERLQRPISFRVVRD